MKYFVALLLLIVFVPAQAQHALAPEDQHLDKLDHFAAGTVLGAYDWKLGCAAGAAKEINDSRTHGADAQDFLATCVGSGLSHWLGDGKSKLYKYNVVVMILDGVSTDRAIRQGGFEVGYLRNVTGHTPSTAKIVAFTAFKLWLLNESESWDNGFKYGFQWGNAIGGTFVVNANYNVRFK